MTTVWQTAVIALSKHPGEAALRLFTATRVGVTHAYKCTHTRNIPVPWCCAGDLIVSYRSDAEHAGYGFRIWVTKDFDRVHSQGCTEVQDVDFDIKEMPHSIYGCPQLTHDQLVAHVVRFSDKVLENVTKTGGKDPFLRTHLFLPSQPQCVSPCIS